MRNGMEHTMRRRLALALALLIGSLTGGVALQPGAADAATCLSPVYAFYSNGTGKYVTTETTYGGSDNGMLRAAHTWTGGLNQLFRFCRTGSVVNIGAFRSLANDLYVTAEITKTDTNYGMLRARSTTIGGWETFTVFGDWPEVSTADVNLYSNANSRYVATEVNYPGNRDGMLRARTSGATGGWETYRIICISGC
ncbi:hypothetical protein HH310_41925 [Actinoplanes sp. TBRC 11911]|uniref:fascin domain-containing protein n=1 Tax=Actinoplanes sp. TBRC 11911 TaxID=2729386 RepID=UPI00145D0D2C|nr:hypothetical protein [Actinoplanes sp. TBRC 11911]NMO57709.1 hypothetical protein [Actinoplanes sp. TBRC 11911]